MIASSDGGETWSESLVGGDVHRLAVAPEDPGTVLYAGDTSDDGSHLFASTDAGETWERVDDQFPKVWRLEAVPEPRG